MMEQFMAMLRAQRSDYHLTLGGLIKRLATVLPDATVTYDDGASPGRPLSYRGYYSDLAFEDAAQPVTVSQWRAEAERALCGTFAGYKGGDYVMDEQTPLWRSEYGEASGIAIIDIRRDNGAVLIITKNTHD